MGRGESVQRNLSMAVVVDSLHGSRTLNWIMCSYVSKKLSSVANLTS